MSRTRSSRHATPRPRQGCLPSRTIPASRWTPGGRPGIHAARYAGSDADDEANNDRLLAELGGTGIEKRTARYRCAMAFVRDASDPSPVIAEASWEGRIGFARRGRGGFGYDPLFLVGDGTLTAAEMPPEEKNRVSHRGQALAGLAAKMKAAGW